MKTFQRLVNAFASHSRFTGSKRQNISTERLECNLLDTDYALHQLLEYYGSHIWLKCWFFLCELYIRQNYHFALSIRHSTRSWNIRLIVSFFSKVISFLFTPLYFLPVAFLSRGKSIFSISFEIFSLMIFFLFYPKKIAMDGWFFGRLKLCFFDIFHE